MDGAEERSDYFSSTTTSGRAAWPAQPRRSALGRAPDQAPAHSSERTRANFGALQSGHSNLHWWKRTGRSFIRSLDFYRAHTKL